MQSSIISPREKKDLDKNFRSGTPMTNSTKKLSEKNKKALSTTKFAEWANVSVNGSNNF